MSVPILTSDGVLSQRVIIDDYFKAGETLKAGQAVTYGPDPITPFGPTAWLVDDDGATEELGRKAIGVVYAAPTDTVGTTVKATAGQLVPVVVLGITKGISGGAIVVGEAVVGDTTPGRLVAANPPTAGKMYGKALSGTSGVDETFDVLVSLG